MKGSKFGGNPRKFKKNKTKVGKSASQLLRNTDNLIHIFGEQKGKQLIKEHSPCCGICRIEGHFANSNGDPVYFNGDPVELGEYMSTVLGDEFIFYVYQPGNFVILGTEAAREQGICSIEYIAENFEEFSENDEQLQNNIGGPVEGQFRIGDIGELQLEFTIFPEKVGCVGEKCFSNEWVAYDYKYPMAYQHRLHPGLIYVYGLNYLDDPLLYPTEAQMDAYTYNNTEASNWRTQRSVNIKEQVERVLFQSTDPNPYSWNDATFGPPSVNLGSPTALNGDLFSTLNQDVDRNIGWTSIPYWMTGCSCNRSIEQAYGAENNFPFKLRLLGTVLDYVDLPTVGPFQIGDYYRVINETHGSDQLWWTPGRFIGDGGTCWGESYKDTINPYGMWSTGINGPAPPCFDFVFSLEGCLSNHRARRDSWIKAFNEYNLSHHVVTWFAFFFIEYQVKKFLI